MRTIEYLLLQQRLISTRKPSSSNGGVDDSLDSKGEQRSESEGQAAGLGQLQVKSTSSQGELMSLAAGGAAAGFAAYKAASILKFRYQCYHCAQMMNQGQWPIMSPEQKKLALLYYDTAFWKEKLAFVQGFPYWVGAIALLPGMMDTTGKDLTILREWVFETRPYSQNRQKHAKTWDNMHGAQTARFDSKVFRFISTVSLFCLGAVAVATGGIGSSPFLAHFAALLESTALGSSSIGIIVGGTYSASAGQKTAKEGFRFWNKLRSGLPLQAVSKLNKQQQRVLCHRLSLFYYDWLPAWFNKVRIRWASGDSYLPAKAWVTVNAPDEQKAVADNVVSVNGRYYRVDNKFRSYRGTGNLIGLIAGVTAGAMLFGPIGALVLGYLGYKIGGAIGASVSFCQKPTAVNPKLAAGGINQVLYERLEHTKFQLARHNAVTHLVKHYYLNTWDSLGAVIANKYIRIIPALILGSAALALDVVLVVVRYLPVVLLNIKNYFGHSKIGDKIKLQWKVLSIEGQTAWRNGGSAKVKFVAKTVALALAGLVIGLLKLPKAVCGAVFAILNPFTQTGYWKKKQHLQSEKRWLKKELHQQALMVAHMPLQASLANEASDNKKQPNSHVQRYHTHLKENYKRDFRQKSCFSRGLSASTLSMFGADSSKRGERRKELTDAGIEVLPEQDESRASGESGYV